MGLKGPVMDVSWRSQTISESSAIEAEGDPQQQGVQPAFARSRLWTPQVRIAIASPQLHYFLN
jgi:hypothetical protein